MPREGKRLAMFVRGWWRKRRRWRRWKKNLARLGNRVAVVVS